VSMRGTIREAASPRPRSTDPADAPVDPALRRFVEALARADARDDYRVAAAREVGTMGESGA
jgi:hypothetical protein